MLKSLALFIAAMPELIKLIKNIQKRIDKQSQDKKVREEIKKINKAFEENNAEDLVYIFND